MRADIRRINAKLEHMPHGDMGRVKNPQNLELTSSYLSRIDASNPLHIEARSMFKDRWLNPERHYSSIQAIYEVVYRGKSAMRHLQQYDDYRSKLRSEQPRNRLVEEILFHCWTRRACNIGDDGSASAIPCSVKGCNLCHVLQCDFSGDNARRGGNWGTGIYLTTSSEKADAYARNLNDRSGKRHLVLLSKVLVGTPKRVYVKNKSLTQPPSGTDSIKAMTKDIGGVVKYSERVVYRDDAVLPWLVIIYDR
ncbi:hypothetical protein BDQ12DRAFT_455997 [Crucibulum laeve]|uniref:PARP catalytic domain-containing protein n=1 Tax=Crucibulum laeve TaxID=68775 RepID=A0A5C3M523_9AGAR|nr:hypothetical protein BDQ12DRAFT_455997 [Crucibulum laeve]